MGGSKGFKASKGKQIKQKSSSKIHGLENGNVYLKCSAGRDVVIAVPHQMTLLRCDTSMLLAFPETFYIFIFLVLIQIKLPCRR